MKHTLLHKLIYATVACVLVVVSFNLLNKGMTQIKDTRYLSRLQIVPIQYAFEGDYLIKGQARGKDKIIITPQFKQEALLFESLVEQSYRDSDGDQQWRTISYETAALDFYLVDSTASVIVSVNDHEISNMEIEYHHSKTTNQGDYRYTEKWIALYDELTVYGNKISSLHNVFTLSPNSEKPYFINGNGKDAQLQDIGLEGLFKIWGGLSLITLALILILLTFSSHRIIKFLSLLSIVQIVLLLIIGAKLIAQDLDQTVENVIDQQSLLEYFEDDQVKNKFVSEYYQQLYSNAYHQTHSFPDNVVGFLSNIRLPKEEFEILKSNTDIIEIKQPYVFWIMLASIVLFIVFLWVGIKVTLIKRLIENVPTSKIKGLMIGLSEVKGTAIQYNDQLLKAPFTNTQCYWYQYKEEEKTRSGKDESWKTIEEKSEWKLFKCRDDSDAELVVNPNKSEISSEYKKTQTIGKRRYTETCLPFGEDIYLFGNTSVGSATGKLMMKNEEDQRLIVSTYGEESIMLKKGLIAMVLMGLVFSISILFGLLAFGLIGSFDPSNYFLIGLFVPLFLILMVTILHYNDLLFLQNRVDRNFANIQVSLKKRYDLMTNLQKVVAGFMDHEKNLLNALSKLRSNFKKITDKDFATADRVKKVLQQDTKFQSYFNMVVEQYPDLKSNELIQDFMTRQTNMEDEISLIREGYNDAVTCYNERIQSFPDLYLAKWFGFTKKRYS